MPKTKTKAKPKAQKKGKAKASAKKPAAKKPEVKKDDSKAVAKQPEEKKQAPYKKPEPKKVIVRRTVDEKTMERLREAAIEFVTFEGDKGMMKKVHEACRKDSIAKFTKLHGEVSGHAGKNLYFDMSSKGLALSDKPGKAEEFPFFWTIKECFAKAKFFASNLDEKEFAA